MAATRSDSLTSAVFAFAVSPFVLAVGIGSGAVLRYVTGLPLWLCSLVGLGVVAFAGGRSAAVMARGMVAGQAIVALAAVCVGILMLWSRLWKPEWFGMATVGGGDNGHHIWIANQLAHEHPRVYQGFTSFHAANWALSHVFGGPFEGMRAAFYVSVAGWFAGSVGLAAVVAKRTQRPVWCTGLACSLLVVVWHRLHLMWASYNQADGFVAHLHSANMLVLMVLVWFLGGSLWRRAWAMLAAIVLFRFTYALNAADVLLASAAVLGPAFWAARQQEQRWSTLGLIGCVGAVAAALVAFAMLWPKFPKPGGIMAPDPRWILLSLSAAVAALATMPTSVLARSPQLKSALGFAAGLTAVPALLVLLHFAAPSLPREYYFHKYPFAALLIVTTLLPALLGAAAIDLWTAKNGGMDRLFARRIAGFAVFSLAAGSAILAADRGHAVTRESYLERSGVRAESRQTHRLHHLGAERVVRAVLREKGRSLAAYLHPSWPVFNFTDNVLRAWAPAPKRPVKGLQDERWELYLEGIEPTSQTCVFWRDGPATDVAFSALQQRHPRAKVRGRIVRFAADPRHRCRVLKPGKLNERVCWLCP